jgi:hypothetical protein
VGRLLQDKAFVQETESNFETAIRHAQPILSIYGDDYTSNILEILHTQFCTPGALNVVKDSVNPLFMSVDGYDRLLKTRGHSETEYSWRSSEFMRFKSGMDAVLKAGTPYREILSLMRLNDIVLRGSCRMAGLYFMEHGYIDLDRQGCLDIINGYIHYLENEPSFSLIILDDLSVLHQSNCWHLKSNQSLGIHCWQGAEPVMIHSNQLILIREFQSYFDKLWAQGEKAGNSRAGVISLLRDVAKRLEREKALLC